MKNLHIILLAVAAGLFVGCQKEKKGPLDPSAIVAINAPKETQANETAATKAEGEQQRLTPRQVIEQATHLFYYPLGKDKNGQPNQAYISEYQRDLINNRILADSRRVIDELGYVNTNFLDGSDFLLMIDRGHNFYPYLPSHPYYLLNNKYDTIAYIPSRIMKEASAKIKAAYAKGDYATCYKLFEEAYVFYPITGKELKELQEKGEE